MAMTAAEFRNANRGVFLHERYPVIAPQGDVGARPAGTQGGEGAPETRRFEAKDRAANNNRKLPAEEAKSVDIRPTRLTLANIEENSSSGWSSSSSSSSDAEVGGLGALSSFSLPGGPRKPGPRTAMIIMLEGQDQSSAGTGPRQPRPALPAEGNFIVTTQRYRQARWPPQDPPFLSLDGTRTDPLLELGQGDNGISLSLDSPSYNFYEKPPWLAAGHDYNRSSSVEDFDVEAGGGLTGLDRKVASDAGQPRFVREATTDRAPHVRIAYRPGAMKREADPVNPSSTSVVDREQAAVTSGVRCPPVEPRNSRIRLESRSWSKPPVVMEDNVHANGPIEWGAALNIEREGTALHGASVHESTEDHAVEPEMESDIKTGGVVGHDAEELADSPKAADETPPRCRGQLWGALLASVAVLCPVGLFLLHY